MGEIAVIGCGTMGHSIALNAAWAGYDVKLYGLNEDVLNQGWNDMMDKADVLIKHHMINSHELEKIKSRVITTVSIEHAVEQATFVIEAIPEDINLKKNLFKELDQLCNTSVVLASNTSGLSPTEIASDMSHPERAIVTHFWNPAHLIPLVEVVPGEQTSGHTIDHSMKLMSQMSKKPIRVNKDVPGFVGNRLQYALFREAQHLLEEGIASKEDVDAAITYSIGRRLPKTGPFMTADMGGLDVFTAISNYLFDDLSKASSSLTTISRLVEEGKLGVKSGEGFYQWDPSFSEKINGERERELIHFLKQDLDIE
ncbi:3-hydroxybutyryl-CoA dehydrogenase [Halobacillus karajensis]|uniref:L-gulonate 3-dehydrogenase n=1 Tax=Halobacillus karajensis TaxID=195088 RepID=A0A059NY49_9BACI|nr:3-hydroxyacyl-CoA dehydrogenase family protein [Halobacillus karajensis]CDQ18999.1 3-hydroxyadipyl-CoA dehydrogenase [Halobacillus karajensis]CDQ22927.1 3-hydroxyadipyl-CoA dehydrogenase [Halobacillus karajensis]CDQ26409.1 3-hydroxyadipyl-CoA dehydrogenase [Halobacillus karajensis]SEH43179.1 3-hydroxybutyryl-CoA dehydrogenase [Halobacillus karajensis]